MAKRELALECDYEYEARCRKRFKQLVEGDPAFPEYMRVPAVVDELSGKTVLCSEYVPGVHIDKVSTVGLPVHCGIPLCTCLHWNTFAKLTDLSSEWVWGACFDRSAVTRVGLHTLQEPCTAASHSWP